MNGSLWTENSVVMRLLPIVTLIFFICGSLASEAENRCPRHLPHTDRLLVRDDLCYQFVSKEDYWDDARNFCWAYGGHLVHIRDSATNEFIINQIAGLGWTNQGVWIGLHDRNSELDWEWVGTSRNAPEAQLGWSNWDSDHPGAFFHSRRDCVRMARESGWQWHETPCHFLKWHYRFICVYDALPLTTTTPPVQGANEGLVGGLVASTEPSPNPTPAPTTTPTQTPTSYATPTTRENKPLYLDKNLEFPKSMAQKAKGGSSHQGMVMIIVGVVLGVLILVLLAAVIYGLRRWRQKKTPVNIELEYPPKFDNPLYGNSESGVAQALLCNSNSDESSQTCNDSPPHPNNLYVSHEEMEGTGVKNNQELEPCGNTCTDEQANDYLMPVGVRPLPSHPTNCETSQSRMSGGSYLPMGGASSADEVGVGLVYDQPKIPNIYAEIPGGDPDANIYESLDDAVIPSVFTL